MKKIFLFLFAFCCSLFARSQSYQQLVYEFVGEWKDVAITEMNRVGIPASVTLAQGIIESNAGHSPMAADANNYFGIKCHSDWTGKTYTYTDDAVDECFRSYDKAADSWKDHSDFLKKQSRYEVLFTYEINDYTKWCYGLKACGYATNPKYPQILINCIETFKLHQYDLTGDDLAKWLKKNDSLNVVTASSDTTNSAVKIVDENPNNTIVGANSATRTFLFNDIKITKAKVGETWESIGNYYMISLKRILKYNDLTVSVTLKEGDKIYLQPKRLKGDEEKHTVKNGETMWSISQQHGVQLEELYKKNLLTTGQQPQVGEEIFLRDTRTSAPKLVSASTPIVTNPVVISPVNNSSATQFYIVKSGDTLYSISKTYNTTVDALKQKNKLTSNTIYIGQKLLVK